VSQKNQDDELFPQLPQMFNDFQNSFSGRLSSKKENWLIFVEAMGKLQIAVAMLPWANCSHPLCLCSPSSKTGSSPLNDCGGNCGPGEK